MVVIKKMGVWSVAKIEALVFAILGLIEGIMVALFAPSALAGMQTPVPWEFTLGPWAIIALPLVYLALGFAVGVIGAVIYNVFAKLVGGIEIEFDEDKAFKPGKKK
ncbi:MAG: DUF3566 domain-containing protein [archaeon]